MKGKPWSVEEEKKLKQMLESKKHVNVIAEALGKTVDGVKSKMRRLGLKEVDTVKKIMVSSSSDLELPEDLPSVEEQLKVLAAALKALQTSGIQKTEIIRLRSVIQGAEAYIDRFAEYLNYRGLEAKVEELIRELEKDGKDRKEASGMAGKARTP